MSNADSGSPRNQDQFFPYPRPYSDPGFLLDAALDPYSGPNFETRQMDIIRFTLDIMRVYFKGKRQ
jgi:hypothetical protein